jgi:hypothetical protein
MVFDVNDEIYMATSANQGGTRLPLQPATTPGDNAVQPQMSHADNTSNACLIAAPAS